MSTVVFDGAALTVDDGNAYLAAGLAGLGVLWLPYYMARPHLASGPWGFSSDRPNATAQHDQRNLIHSCSRPESSSPLAAAHDTKT